jgi:hypothetical protein
MHHDGNRRSNCDQNDHYCEYLRHIVPPLARIRPFFLFNRRSRAAAAISMIQFAQSP